MRFPAGRFSGSLHLMYYTRVAIKIFVFAFLQKKLQKSFSNFRKICLQKFREMTKNLWKVIFFVENILMTLDFGRFPQKYFFIDPETKYIYLFQCTCTNTKAFVNVLLKQDSRWVQRHCAFLQIHLLLMFSWGGERELCLDSRNFSKKKQIYILRNI